MSQTGMDFPWSFYMPKILAISVESQMERSLSVRSNKNIRYQLVMIGWTKFKPAHFPIRSFCLGKFGNGIKNGKSHSSWLFWFEQKFFLGYSRGSLTGGSGLMESTLKNISSIGQWLTSETLFNLGKQAGQIRFTILTGLQIVLQFQGVFTLHI